MVTHIALSGRDYKNIVQTGRMYSGLEIQKAIKAAKTYDWECKDIGGAYPQTLVCKKTGAKAIKRNAEDLFLWNETQNELLMLTSDEFIIKGIIT